MYSTFAWRYFRAKKSANAINIIAWVTTGVIAFATCCQILVLSVFNGFEDLVKSLYSSFYTDLKIIPAYGKTFIATPNMLAKAAKQTGVKAISMIAEDKAILQNGEFQTFVNIKGVDSNYIKVSGVPQKLISGRFNVGSVDAPGLVAGAGIQNAANISMNNAFSNEYLTITLPKKNSEGSADPLSFLSEGNITANGVFAIQQDFDNNYAITNIDFVKRQMGFGINEFSAAELQVDDKADVTETKNALQLLFGRAFIVQTRFEQNSNLYNTMRVEKWAIYAVLTLILIIAAFNMVSALTMLVLEKQKDISILQSMGAGRHVILKIFLSEGLLLGMLGACAGIGLAAAICLLQIKFEFIKLMGGSFLINYFPVKLVATDFLLVATTAIAITILASLLPAFKASQQITGLK